MENKEIRKEQTTPQVTPDAVGGTQNGIVADRGEKKPFGAKAKRRVCSFCALKGQTYIDYKDIARLKKYITENGKIIPRRQTGVCARHQRELATAIKRARTMSLL